MSSNYTESLEKQNEELKSQLAHVELQNIVLHKELEEIKPYCKDLLICVFGHCNNTILNNKVCREEYVNNSNNSRLGLFRSLDSLTQYKRKKYTHMHIESTVRHSLVWELEFSRVGNADKWQLKITIGKKTIIHSEKTWKEWKAIFKKRWTSKLSKFVVKY